MMQAEASDDSAAASAAVEAPTQEALVSGTTNAEAGSASASAATKQAAAPSSSLTSQCPEHDTMLELKPVAQQHSNHASAEGLRHRASVQSVSEAPVTR